MHRRRRVTHFCFFRIVSNSGEINVGPDHKLIFSKKFSEIFGKKVRGSNFYIMTAFRLTLEKVYLEIGTKIVDGGHFAAET